ncbi:putative deoxynucleotide monophosphate kinase [Brazilian marseillevirus]|uniref:putative deoxynucleotide monophosphate kinase n=1 Tax=Brazilian marseillevirus TaxID=1813599 RepID=UPI0007811398|nr:putative deoxynucleotide monophosphate kinase [Brazilian marseillevirus]AMQ10771.1 putative deoxynucleotide monophosphate kinase [Brazilian marseillevirus]
MKVAFGPFMRSGKDTACEWLKDMYGGKIYRFSHKLYETTEAVQKTLGFPVEKDRELLLLLGKYAKDRNPTVFIDQVKQKILENSGENIFVSDVRREEEAWMLKEQGFILVKILRDCERSYCQMEEEMSKSDIFDITVENNGTLEEFIRKLGILFPKELVACLRATS